MSTFSDALVLAAAFCSTSEHCKSEVLGRIADFELSVEDQAKLIQRLQQEGFLDEKRYVKAFVNDKFRFNKWGRIKIRYMLKQKGIASDLIEEGILQIPEDEYHEILLALLKQKRPILKSRNVYELRGKMLRYAAGKGFEPSLICRCLGELNNEEEE